MKFETRLWQSLFSNYSLFMEFFTLEIRVYIICTLSLRPLVYAQKDVPQNIIKCEQNTCSPRKSDKRLFVRFSGQIL